jgi:hypothetical protein
MTSTSHRHRDPLVGSSHDRYARDFVDAGEYVLAIELLCDQLYEYEIPVTAPSAG